MTRKPRRPIDRCDFCGKRMSTEDFAPKYAKSPEGWVSILGAAHKTCIPKPPEPVTQ
jgi:hypothetical protein